MSNEGASITAPSNVSDGTAFNNGHRQQTDRPTGREEVRQSEIFEKGTYFIGRGVCVQYTVCKHQRVQL